MDNYMKKFYKENYNVEQLKQLNKMNKLLTDAYYDILNKRNKNFYQSNKNTNNLKGQSIEELFNKIDEMYYLTSFISKEKIIDIIIKCNGDEDKIQDEIETII